MGTQPMRIRLDLTKVETPPYKYVWFPVSPCALSTISDLKSGICKKFHLQHASVQLFVEGGLMQDEDTILLLRDNDVVQVLYTRENSLQSEVHSQDSMHPVALQEAQYVRKEYEKQCSFNENSDLCLFPKSTRTEISNNTREMYVYDGQADDCLPRKKKCKKKKEVDFHQNCYLKTDIHHDSENIEVFPVKDITLDACDADNVVESSLKSEVKCKKRKKQKDCLETPNISVESNRSNFEQCNNDSANINADVSTLSLDVNFNVNKSMHSTELAESTPRKIRKDEHEVRVPPVQTEGKGTPETLRRSNCKKKRKRKRKRKRNIGSPSSSFDSTPGSLLMKADASVETSKSVEKGSHIFFKFSSGSESGDSRPEPSNAFTLEEKVLPLESKSGDLEPPKTNIKKKLVSCSQSKDSSFKNAMHFKGVNLAAMKKHFNFSPCVESNDSTCDVSVTSDNCVLNETHIDDSETDKCNSGNFSTTDVQQSQCQETVPESVMQVNGHNASVENSESSAVVSPGKKLVSVNKQDYTQYSALNTLPPTGSHIAFKILELSELYCPEVSVYKEGVVVDFNPETDDITIELIQHELKAPRNGKFENLYPNDVIQPEVVKKVTAKWPELIEPKLISAVEK